MYLSIPLIAWCVCVLNYDRNCKRECINGVSIVTVIISTI